MSKYDKISNYNVVNENFNNIVREFEGYLLGLSKNDFLLFNDNLNVAEQLEYLAEAASVAGQYDNDQIFKKEIAPKIFDRTTGGYFIQDYTRSSQLNSTEKIDNMGEYLHLIFGEGKGFSTDSFDISNNVERFSDCVVEVAQSGSEGSAPYAISKILPYVNILKINRQNKKDNQGNDIKDANGEIVKEISHTGLNVEEDDGGVIYPGLGVDPGNPGPTVPNRLTTPSLTAQTIRIDGVGINGRQGSHLPIFFGGIPPIEMSRCVPYLDVKIISTDFGEIDRLNQVSFMRFVKNGPNGEYTTYDGIGALNNTADIIGEQTSKSGTKNKVSNMNIFTSPQTMANANINRMNGEGTFDQTIETSLFGAKNQNNPVYEPISPFLTLKSFDVSITGAGAGLFASKSGSLKLILHDRSRMKDLAPLLATDRFATTKIQIEFGWNHPDGTVGGENIIGQYLDGLKDIHIYQVVGSDYSFGDGGAVDITVKLVAYGFRENKKVHCGAGPFVPINSLTDLIETAVFQLNSKINQDKDYPPEVRQKLKLNARSARSLNSIVTWEEWKFISEYLGKDKSKDELLNIIKAVLSPEVDDDNSNLAAENALRTVLNKDENKETLIRSMFGKIFGLRRDYSTPFVYSFHKNLNTDVIGLIDYKSANRSSIVDKYRIFRNSNKKYTNLKDDKPVTLGKLLMSFVGWPLASTCAYDEVQMIFYPLNHHAGLARGHTTASLPIPLNRVEEMLIDQINKNSHITVETFVNLLERKLIRDRALPAYGFSEITSLSQIERLKDNKTPDQKFWSMIQILVDTNGQGLNESDETDKQIKSLVDKTIRSGTDLTAGNSEASFNATPDNIKPRIRELYNDHITKLKNSIDTEIRAKCKSYYEKDGLGLAEPKFVPPNLAMVFETVPAIDIQNVVEGSFVSNLWEGVKNGIGLENNESNGLTEKTILRIHVYDEESVSSPEDATLLSAINNKSASSQIIGKNKDEESIRELIDKLSFGEMKEYIKRNVPTLVYGASTSTVKSLSVSANTSGDLANVLMIEAYGGLQNGQVDGQSYDTSFEEVVVFPNTVSVGMLGMPMISRGTTLFIDFGTNTSLDGIYTVTSVSHNIGPGEFSTTLQLSPTGQGAVTSFKDKLANAIALNNSQ